MVYPPTLLKQSGLQFPQGQVLGLSSISHLYKDLSKVATLDISPALYVFFYLYYNYTMKSSIFPALGP